MNLSIKNIKLGELDGYLQSEEYKKSSFVPISKIRALSHINNPRANKNDICLFLAYNNRALIGYLGAIADSLFIDENPERVYWLSCMWVLPEYRRDGVALKLLVHAYDCFKGKVLITNFIPRSKGAFDRTSQYFDLAKLNGVRAYALLDSKTLVTRRYPKLKYIKPVLKVIDGAGNLFLQYRQKQTLKKLSLTCSYTEIKSFDASIRSFITDKVNTSLFRRGVDGFNWIKNYPWVIKVDKQTDEAKRYYFSQESEDFEQLFIKVQQKDAIVGILIITIFRGELKIPYLFYKLEFVEDMARYIARLLIGKGVKTYVGYDALINEKLSSLGIFFHTRPSIYGFIAGKEMEQMLKGKDVKLFYGDGDGAFT
jgi:GNAT superfamily N-acetyltransferase